MSPPRRPSTKKSFSARLSFQMGESFEGKVVNLTKWKTKAAFIYETVAGFDLLGVIFASTIISFAISMLEEDSQWITMLSSSTAGVSTLGAFYSFALVFRTNICYQRWWEGRTLWGKIIVLSIRITHQGRLWMRDEQLVERMNCMGVTFVYACKALLRRNSLDSDAEDGNRLVRIGILEQEELDFMVFQKGWQPFYCIDVMRNVKLEALAIRVGQDDIIVSDHIKAGAFTEMENTISGLSSAMGGCIRVQATGLPIEYNELLNVVGGIFFITATFAWAPTAGYYNPVIIFLIYVAAKMIVRVGNDMEDPFGDDPSDLPLGKFCTTVERQIGAVEERYDMITYNIVDGPARLPGKPTVSFCDVSEIASTYTTASSLPQV